MEFSVLGPVVARHVGVPLDLGRRGQRLVLGLLLLDAGRLVAADRLVSLLWDDEPPPGARGVLQTHVSRLRRVIDPARDGTLGVRLLSQGAGYRLDVDPDAVDASRFRALVGRA